MTDLKDGLRRDDAAGMTIPVGAFPMISEAINGDGVPNEALAELLLRPSVFAD